MSNQTKEGKARNEQLLKSYKNYQKSIDEDLERVKAVIAEALGSGIDENTMDELASIFRGYEYIKPIAENAWEKYQDHCDTFGYDVE